MSRDDREREFRLRPERPPRVRDDSRAWSNAFKRIIHFARITSKRNPSRQKGRISTPHNQRCAVRVTYAPNRIAGQWAAHGRYISRVSAAGENLHSLGFGSAGSNIDIPKALGSWQKAGDPRLFKLIISPEFGERLDLKTHTRNLMARMERDLGTKLEWLAVIHRNTEHPHVHVAFRGIDERGTALRLPRDYIKNAIRQHAEELATEQLGYRTQVDAEEAQRREVHQARFTSLDRAIRKSGQLSPDGATITIGSEVRSVYAKRRLIVLQEMGLAEQKSGEKWRVNANFEYILREMQKVADRQKTLAAHRALMSDPNLPFQVTDLRKIDRLRGRVLGHGEEESTGRMYMLLEGDDHKVHFIYHNRAIQEARHEGQLSADARVVLNRNGKRIQCFKPDAAAEKCSDKVPPDRGR